MRGLLFELRTMAAQKETYYDILGVPRNAKNTDINRAYNKLIKANQREDVPPDARRDVRIQEAYATLSDLDRREAYDKSLIVTKAKGGGQLIAAASLIVLVVGGAGYYFADLSSEEAARKATRSTQEIRADASRSVGRVQAIDISGKTAPTGLAFAIEDNVMATTCDGLAPGAQIVVDLPARTAPARLTERNADTGLCKLTVDGGGVWPLPLSGAGAGAGDTVFATNAPEGGNVALAEGTVTRVRDAPKGRVIETSMPAPAAKGAPLLDATGRVVGIVAGNGGGKLHYVAIPEAWLQPKAAPEKAPVRNVEPVDDAPAAKAADPQPPVAMPKTPVNISPERKEELRKAFRPDPNVPPDL